MTTLSKIGISILCVLVALGVAYTKGRNNGMDKCNAEREAAIETALAEQNKLIEQLKNRQPEVRESVRTIYKTIDSSGCADVTIPSGMLEQLRSTD